MFRSCRTGTEYKVPVVSYGSGNSAAPANQVARPRAVIPDGSCFSCSFPRPLIFASSASRCASSERVQQRNADRLPIRKVLGCLSRTPASAWFRLSSGPGTGPNAATWQDLGSVSVQVLHHQVADCPCESSREPFCQGSMFRHRVVAGLHLGTRRRYKRSGTVIHHSHIVSGRLWRWWFPVC